VTEYHTAERTATTPLHVSTTPHLAYLLVLLALLAADIATTVWFTRLGLPETNPFLAPIAGSVAAQIAYKAPFALLLAGGTALLATACDRLRPAPVRGREIPVAVRGRHRLGLADRDRPGAVPEGNTVRVLLMPGNSSPTPPRPPLFPARGGIAPPTGGWWRLLRSLTLYLSSFSQVSSWYFMDGIKISKGVKMPLNHPQTLFGRILL